MPRSPLTPRFHFFRLRKWRGLNQWRQSRRPQCADSYSRISDTRRRWNVSHAHVEHDWAGRGGRGSRFCTIRPPITSKPATARPQRSPQSPLPAPPTSKAATRTPGVAVDNPAVEGSDHRELADVFRFNITPNWVMGQWPRVSTGMSQIQLVGYRVTLVTGIAPDDIAGLADLLLHTPATAAADHVSGHHRRRTKAGRVPDGKIPLRPPRSQRPNPLALRGAGSRRRRAAKRFADPIGRDRLRADEPYRRFRVNLSIERMKDEG